MKTERWLDHDIRFVEVKDEWHAILSDIATALELRTDKIASRIDKDNLSKVTLGTKGGNQKVSAINEIGIYQAIFSSRKPQAKDFQNWIFQVIKELRQSTGLEGFEVFRMLDKEHQKQAMQRLQSGLNNPVKVNFIKANTIANKAVSTRYGHPKMLKKDQMSVEMLKDREPILDDTVNLMTADESFKLGLSVSKRVYNKYCNAQITA